MNTFLIRLKIVDIAFFAPKKKRSKSLKKTRYSSNTWKAIEDTFRILLQTPQITCLIETHSDASLPFQGSRVQTRLIRGFHTINETLQDTSLSIYTETRQEASH